MNNHKSIKYIITTSLTAVVIALTLMGCNEDKTQWSADKIFGFSYTILKGGTTVSADSTTQVALLCVLRDKTADRQTVCFTTTSGSFADSAHTTTSKVLFNNKDTAMVYWNPGVVPGTATLSAYVVGAEQYVSRQQVTVAPSYPDMIHVTSDHLSVNDTAPATVTLTAYLTKSTLGASVSNGLPFTFRAVQVIGGVTQNVGNLSATPYLYTASGRVMQSSYVALDGIYDITQPVMIMGSFPSNAAVKSDTLLLHFVH